VWKLGIISQLQYLFFNLFFLWNFTGIRSWALTIFHLVILLKKTISYHFYADFTQLYLSFDTNDTNQLNNLHTGIADINNWMVSNFLQLNSEKSESIIIGGLIPELPWFYL